MTLTKKSTGVLEGRNEEVKLLDVQEAVTDGEWHPIRGRDNYTIEFSGIVDGTVQIRSSNDYNDNKPNSEDGSSVGDDITTNITVQMDANVKFIKVKKTVAGTDTVTAILRT